MATTYFMIIKCDIRNDYTLAAEILTVQRLAYQVESKLIDYPNLPPLFESVADILSSGEQFLVFVERRERVGQGKVTGQDKILGTLSYTVSHGDSCCHLLEIGRLVVHPQHFGLGIASALLRAVETQHADIGQIRVSTAEKNVPAITLYQKAGYQIIRREILPDGLVLVKLQKILIT